MQEHHPQLRLSGQARLDWVTSERDLREHGDLVRVREYLESLTNPGNALVSVSLSGLLMADERAELDHIEQILGSRFLWGELDASRLRPSPEDETWISNLPPGIIRDAAMRLRDTTGASSEIAARALMELYAIVAEVSQ